MKNPFVAVAKNVGSMYASTQHSDCVAPGLCVVGAVIATPFVAVGSFAAALMDHS